MTNALPFIALLLFPSMSILEGSLTGYEWTVWLGYFVSFFMLSAWLWQKRDLLRRLMFRKASKYSPTSLPVIVLTLIALAGIANVSSRSRFNHKIDMTKASLNTLSRASVEVLNRLKTKPERVQMSGFFQDQVAKENFRDLIDLYISEGAPIDVTYYDPRSHPDKILSLKITAPNTVLLNYESRDLRISTFTEEKITNALLNIYKKSVRKIYFLKGHGEPSTNLEKGNTYNSARMLLEGQKYQVSEISLLKTANIPSDAEALIIAGPKYDLKPKEAELISIYLEQGGSLLVAVDAVTSVPVLNSVLNSFGLALANDLLILPADDVRAKMFGQNFAVVDTFDDMSGVTKDLAERSFGGSLEMMVPFMRSVELVSHSRTRMNTLIAAKTYSGMMKVSNVETSEDLEEFGQEQLEVGEFGVLGVSSGLAKIVSLGEKNADGSSLGTVDAQNSVDASAADVDASAADVDAKASVDQHDHDSHEGHEGHQKHQGDLGDTNTVTQETTKLNAKEEARNETRLVVFGSSQFMNDQGLQLSKANSDLLGSIISFLTRDNDFVSIPSKRVTEGRIDVVSKLSQSVLLFISYVYPFLFLIAGTLYWLKRRAL